MAPDLCCCVGEEAAQAVTDTKADSVESLQPADMTQEQPVEKPQSEQPVARKFRETEEATGSAGDSTAEVAAFSSSGGGGRYMSVPPSSLWGPPAGVGVTPSSAAAQPAEADSQQFPSTGGNMPGDIGHRQRGSQHQSMYHQHTSEQPGVEREGLESQATGQQPAEEDASTAEVEADLARVQRAQREALQAEDASLQSSRNVLLGVRAAVQQEQGGLVSQNQDRVTFGSMAQTDTEGRQGNNLAPVQEADREADDTMVKTGAELSNGQASHEGQSRQADETLAETESALAGAQEAQQQAVQAQQQALAEERRDLMQLRQHLQQQSGQPAKNVCCSALCICCTCNNNFAPVPAVGCTMGQACMPQSGVRDACLLMLGFWSTKVLSRAP